MNKSFTLWAWVAIIKVATINQVLLKKGGRMPNGADIIKDYVTEFSRLQDWMIPVKEVLPDTYNSMHRRYIELKVTLSSLGVNLSELDRIKE